uniref:Uncharacterized protein LOC102810368 n=1 Tax=Saccoglossus kowalevskii TaxID=10224 RepID=A0ABM0MVM6_SACKO|nr:PREDICTED: uncharacterized protein LOC102810368 [Saccoglossus kowalevskii]
MFSNPTMFYHKGGGRQLLSTEENDEGPNRIFFVLTEQYFGFPVNIEMYINKERPRSEIGGSISMMGGIVTVQLVYKMKEITTHEGDGTYVTEIVNVSCYHILSSSFGPTIDSSRKHFLQTMKSYIESVVHAR